MGRRNSTPDWLQAKRIANEYFEEAGLDAQVPWFDYLGEGLTYTAWASEIIVDGNFGGDIVVRVPADDAEDDQPESALREQQVRHWLRQRADQLDFEIPPIFYVGEARWGLAILEEFAPGFPLDSLTEERWDLVGLTANVAASIHRLPVEDLSTFVPGHETRRQHAEEWAERFEAYDAPEFVAAREWAAENMPPAESARLLHGDLLGQNVIVDVDDAWREVEAVHVIDWDAAMLGDPAYDLAVVSRAYRRPLRSSLEEFVKRYVDAAEIDVTVSHVRLYELALRAKWFMEVLEDEGETAHADQRFKDFAALLRRATGGRR